MTRREHWTLEEVLKALDEDKDLDDVFVEGSDDELEDLQKGKEGTNSPTYKSNH